MHRRAEKFLLGLAMRTPESPVKSRAFVFQASGKVSYLPGPAGTLLDWSTAMATVPKIKTTIIPMKFLHFYSWA